MKYCHLKPEQRYTIALLLQKRLSITEIAETIHVHKSTVSRELKRNREGGQYRAAVAQEIAEIRRARFAQPRKLTPGIEARIRRAIEAKQWSPEQIAGHYRRLGAPFVGKTTIYTYLHEDKANGGDLYTHTRHALKYRKRRLADGPKPHWPRRKSIADRPECIGREARVGDFEMDLILGANGHEAICTLVERKTGYALLVPLPAGKRAKPLARAVNRRLKGLAERGKLHSITTDNGSEFSHFNGIERALGVPVYFAKPYCSTDKARIEHLNKLIRQYLPKGSSFKGVTTGELRAIEWKLNSRPRKKLGYRTPFEVFCLNSS